jgi:glycosyltransferase involved in cell wall biosynthesis
MKNPVISLFITTYNWPEALELCLKSVKNQYLLPDEVIIADDGSTGETKSLIDMMRKDFPVPLTHVWQEDKGFRKARIVNRAVKLSKGDYLIFTDGDIILHPRFISDHYRAIRPGFFLQGSRGMLTPENTKSLIESGKIRLTPFSRGIKNRLNVIRSKILSSLIHVKPDSYRHIIGCNYTFWKKDFIAVNGLNNDFDCGWGHEDSEYAARLINSGTKRKKIKFLAICYHLYHPLAARSKERMHWALFEKTVSEKITRCENGYAQA